MASCAAATARAWLGMAPEGLQAQAAAAMDALAAGKVLARIELAHIHKQQMFHVILPFLN